MLRWPLPRTALPLLGVLLGTALSFSFGYLWSEELWWYLASGNAILDAGAIPEHDVFLDSLDPPAAWLTHSWLWTVWLAGLTRLFGLVALPIFGSLLVAAILTLVYTHARVDRFGLVNTLLVALVVAVAIQRFSLRAELPGWLLLVVFVRVLERGRLGWRSFTLLALLQALWANLHAGFLLGVGVAGVYAVAVLAEDRLFPRRAKRADPARLWLTPALVLASFASTPRIARARIEDSMEVVQRFFAPDDDRSLEGLLEGTSGSEALTILEWQSPFSGYFGALPWLYAAFLLLGILSFVASQRPLRLPRLLLFVAMALLGGWASRFVTGFGIVAALTVTANLTAPAAWLVERRTLLAGSRVRAFHLGASALLGLLCASVGLAIWTSREDFRLEASHTRFFVMNPRYASPGAARYILEHELQGPIFNEYALGGHLEYALYPTHKLFIDARILDYGLLREHAQMLNVPNQWRAKSSHYGFRTVVLSNLARDFVPLREELVSDPRWELVYLDPTASIFVRVSEDAAPGSVAPVVLQPAGDPDRAVPIFLGADGSPAWRVSLSRALLGRAGVDLLGTYLGALLQLHRYADVEALAQGPLEADPDNAILRAHRGFARVRLGRLKAGEADLRAVVEALPNDPQALRNHAIALQQLGFQREAQQQRKRAERIFLEEQRR